LDQHRAFAAPDEQATAGRLGLGLRPSQQRPLSRIAAEQDARRPKFTQPAEHGLIGAASAAADAAREHHVEPDIAADGTGGPAGVGGEKTV